MKKTFFLFLLLLPALTRAQAPVDAKEILGKINRGEAVSYRNATINGTLDLTQLDNRKLRKEPGKWEDSKTYVSTVKAPVSFTNCTFAGDVLAYYHLEDEAETHTADFDEGVVFENCTFKGKSAFKYSRFARGASFAGSRFAREALFKYSHFAGGPNFGKARFEETADFKYARFG
ncbi:MAG: pentapeptide repeat-containing protein, partial [Cytophagales bacterium]|nr:pentapeptide repeat-containing protein [Cytophagales bacterium]